MTRLPWTNRFMATVLLVMLAVQMPLVFQFWGSFGGSDIIMTVGIEVLGVCLALLEPVSLIVCSHAASRGDTAAATCFRIVFVFLFTLNLAGDIGAIYTYTSRDADARAYKVDVYGEAEHQVQDAEARIKALTETLHAQGFDQPSAALAVQRDSLNSLLEQAGGSPETRAWRERQAAKLTAAIITATELEGLKQNRNAAAQNVLSQGARPNANHPQFVALSRVLGAIGWQVPPEDLRLGIAVGLAAVVRMALALGFWLALPNSHAGTASGGGEGERGQSRPQGRDKGKGWTWPWQLGTHAGPEHDPRPAAPVFSRAPIGAAATPDSSTRAQAPMGHVLPMRPRQDVPRRPAVETATSRPRHGRGIKGHDPKTCPTCNAPVSEGATPGWFDELDDFDPKH